MNEKESSLGFHFIAACADQVRCTTQRNSKRKRRNRPCEPARLHFNGKIARRERIAHKKAPRKLTESAVYRIVGSAFALLGRHARPGETMRAVRAAQGARDSADAVKRIIDELNR